MRFGWGLDLASSFLSTHIKWNMKVTRKIIVLDKVACDIYYHFYKAGKKYGYDDSTAMSRTCDALTVAEVVVVLPVFSALKDFLDLSFFMFLVIFVAVAFLLFKINKNRFNGEFFEYCSESRNNYTVFFVVIFLLAYFFLWQLYLLPALGVKYSGSALYHPGKT